MTTTKLNLLIGRAGQGNGRTHWIDPVTYKTSCGREGTTDLRKAHDGDMPSCRRCRESR